VKVMEGNNRFTAIAVQPPPAKHCRALRTIYRSSMPLDPTTAQAFADRWYAAWNAHDLEAIMACYDSAIEHSSPFIKRYNGTDDTALRGIAAVRDYFGRALERNPTLRFDPMYVTTGLESVILVYRRMTGDLAAEVFFLNSAGKIARSVSHYG
jgi:hypothetical protein